MKRIVLLLAVMMLPRFTFGVNVPGQGIKCVEWVGIDPGDGATNMEATTLNGGGNRIFPDKNAPGANGKTHSKVKVKVTVVPDNAPVLLQVFDVDDPTDHDGPIDSDPAGPDLTNPPDNKGGVQKLKVLTGGGGQEGVTVSGNAQNGVFEAELTVSFEPGDTYRVVAACPGFLQGLKAKKADNSAQVIDANNTPVPETCDALAARKSSPLLSVWRRVRVEFDAMDAPAAAEPFGTVVGVSSKITATTLTSQGNPGWLIGSLEGGVLNPNGNAANPVVSFVNKTSWEVSFTFANAVDVLTDYSQDTFDNDVDGGADAADPQGPQGEIYQLTPADPSNLPFAINTDDVRWDPTGQIQGALSPETPAVIIPAINVYYLPAYIECKELEAGNAHPTFAFKRYNFTHQFLNTVDVAGEPTFWTVCVAWNYEAVDKNNVNPQTCPHPMYDGDEDPKFEGAPPENSLITLGISDAVFGETCNIYRENIRDIGSPVARTVAHEIGHLLGLKHADLPVQENDKGILRWERDEEDFPCVQVFVATVNTQLGGMPEPERFSWNNIKLLRESATD